MWKILWMLLVVLDLGLGFIVPTTFRSPVAPSRPSRQRLRYKEKENAYNDDGFGLVFLGVAAFEKDVEFCATFGILSAIAAAGTNTRNFEKDERAPAAVALATLVLTPFVSAVTRGTGLGAINIVPPAPTEIGLCAVSAAWAFVNWSRTRSDESV
ncbi:hypothetical protein THAOC_16955 [Thalassiosira oceanica]|uniref:Uncharacterized protein n=1 Tax=Thalassiosira oceanica TaxID=159749 RepID=K0SNA2_THAOC|nr:hypothetical protein THAOC_16955 [Thalassiosira oceanica]|eukprot:EJK62436.1 hypothetical protein THAOC_16955 [Thalassiosira oceanica]